VRWRRNRIAELDARVATARERAEAAVEEARYSAERHEEIRTQVVAPLKKAAEHNQFAELIRATLVNGHHNNTRTTA
jgi:hypothetical protein